MAFALKPPFGTVSAVPSPSILPAQPGWFSWGRLSIAK
ncbi:hypothetical protein CES85_2947 (plasmid) [Ochrobactrum quorumnocens]|uniref:Uncharacterized protein n=1 Tax=Ochrobactrum quorumnocens TaxID=271865 RepID=A0A248UNN6_9HYPH|nr:hypothetical protein CES85_2947 [[Ochrobactrum] quorumnocens]